MFFLFALFLPAENVSSDNSSIIGTFVITFPIVLLFLARAIDGITGGNISVANAYLSDLKIGVRTLGKWLHPLTLALTWVRMLDAPQYLHYHCIKMHYEI